MKFKRIIIFLVMFLGVTNVKAQDIDLIGYKSINLELRNSSSVISSYLAFSNTPMKQVPYEQDSAKAVNICTDNGSKLTLRLIGYIMFIAKILVPLLLIIMGVMDFAKAVMSNDEKLMKEVGVKFSKRLLAGVIIFFIPTVLNFLFGLVDGAEEAQGKFSGCRTCLFHPNKCDVQALGEDTTNTSNDNKNGTTVNEREHSGSSGKF